jgi:hypothetical protein
VKKYLNDLLVLVVAFVLLTPLGAQANWFTDRVGDVKTIVGGHIDDFSNRWNVKHQVVEGETIRFGEFRNNDVGQDFAHRTHRGTASVVLGEDGKAYIQFSKDFESTIGPDFHVYASESSGIIDEATFKSAEMIELGKLKNTLGATFYEIKGINPADINSVTIWCKRFNEFIGSADLQ